MPKVYKSAIDLWLAALLAAVPLTLLFTGVSIAFGLRLLHWHESLGRVAGFLFVGGAVVVCALYATFLLPCRYLLAEKEIIIRCGVLEWKIRYADLRRLELSYSFLPAPALSVSRVKIVLDDGSVQLVSPRDRSRFISELQLHMGREAKKTP